MRVEEIPANQLSIGPKELLLPVSHYEKEPSKMFGVGFFTKVVDGEPVANIKKRVKEALEVSDREFDKVCFVCLLINRILFQFKFSLVVNNRVNRDYDQQADTTTVDLAELKSLNLGLFNSTLLGIDHANKSRPTRGHHTEKAIVIHN
jgi:ubiquitin carboxyl-terminal hydrolase 7